MYNRLTIVPSTNTTFPSLLVADVLVNERCKYKAIADEMDQTFADLAGY